MVCVSVPNVTVKVNITRSLALYPLVPASLPLAARLSSRDSFLSRAITFLLLIWNNRNKSNAPPTTHAANIEILCSLWLPLFSIYLLPFARTKEQYSKYPPIPPIHRRETLFEVENLSLEENLEKFISRSLCNHRSESSCPPLTPWRNPPPYPRLCNDERKLFSGTSSRISGWASTICVSSPCCCWSSPPSCSILPDHRRGRSWLADS